MIKRDDKRRDDCHIGLICSRRHPASAHMYDDQPIVDAHHHLWDLEADVRYPWLKQADPHHSYMGDNSALRRSYLPEEYRRDTALHNVSPCATWGPAGCGAVPARFCRGHRI